MGSLIWGLSLGAVLSFLLGVSWLGVAVFVTLIVIFMIYPFLKSNPSRFFDENYNPNACIVICAHNEEKVIHRSLRSALNQDYENLKVVLVDDASTDRTSEVAKEIAGEDNRMILLRNERNLGQLKSMLKAVESVESDIYIFIDADNEIPSDYARKYVKLMKNFDIMGTPISAYNQFDSFTSLLHNAEITALSFILFANLFPSFVGRGMIVKKKVFDFIREKGIKGVDNGAMMNSAVERGKFRYFFPRGPVLREMATTKFSDFLGQRDRWYTLGIYEAMKNGARSVLSAFGFGVGFIWGTVLFSLLGASHLFLLHFFVIATFIFGVILHYTLGLGKNFVQAGFSTTILAFLNVYLITVSLVKAILGEVPERWYRVERS